MNKKVAILLSAYNGAKYIREQVESILNQTYKEITLYVRDDCSTDETLSILKEYEGCGVIVMEGKENLGYPEGFYELLRNVTDADYYGFSDQDDVWMPDKISRAVEKLEENKEEVPAIFLANYDICDEELNVFKKSPSLPYTPGFRHSIFSCLSLGFTMVLNQQAKEMITYQRSSTVVTKDDWIGMLCSAFGKVYFDEKSCALHRRTPEAFTDDSPNFFKMQVARFKTYFVEDGFSYVRAVNEEFYDTFKEELKSEDKKELELFVNRSRNPIHVLKKVFYPHRLRYDKASEIMVRTMFLLGRL